MKIFGKIMRMLKRQESNAGFDENEKD